jgi:hypothetical protein
LSFFLLSKRQKQKHGIRPNSYLKSTFSAEKQSNLGRQFPTEACEKCIFQQLASLDFYITGLCMVRPFGPNLADLTLYCREAAEALKARNIPAQGKHAESVRRPGYNGDHVRVPRPLWPQSAKLTGAKEAMELTCLPGIDIGGMPSRHYQWVTDYLS